MSSDKILQIVVLNDRTEHAIGFTYLRLVIAGNTECLVELKARLTKKLFLNSLKQVWKNHDLDIKTNMWKSFT